MKFSWYGVILLLINLHVQSLQVNQSYCIKHWSDEPSAPYWQRHAQECPLAVRVKPHRGVASFPSPFKGKGEVEVGPRGWSHAVTQLIQSLAHAPLNDGLGQPTQSTTVPDSQSWERLRFSKKGILYFQGMSHYSGWYCVFAASYM